jgi:hypothetical protein
MQVGLTMDVLPSDSVMPRSLMFWQLQPSKPLSPSKEVEYCVGCAVLLLDSGGMNVHCVSTPELLS